VRARLVQGIPSTFVASTAVIVAPLWTSIPGRLLPDRRGEVTSIRVRLLALTFHRAAAERCESSAPDPQARNAASHRPLSLSSSCPAE